MAALSALVHFFGEKMLVWNGKSVNVLIVTIFFRGLSRSPWTTKVCFMETLRKIVSLKLINKNNKQYCFVNRKPSCLVTCEFAFDLLEKLLEPSPDARITAWEALCHRFFGGEVHAVHLNSDCAFRGWALFSDFRIYFFRIKVIWNLTPVLLLSLIPLWYELQKN